MTTDVSQLDLAHTYVDAGVIIINGAGYTVKRAFANVAASQTDSSLVTAVAARKIRVIFWDAVAGGTATNLTFNTKSSAAGVAISQLYANGASGGEVENVNPYGWFETNVGEGLTVTTGTGSTTGVKVGYIEVA